MACLSLLIKNKLIDGHCQAKPCAGTYKTRPQKRNFAKRKNGLFVGASLLFYVVFCYTISHDDTYHHTHVSLKRVAGGL